MTKIDAKQKRRKRKLLIALLMILLTGVIATTSTYAWFTSNRTVTIEHIDVNVVATDGLQISVDGTTWKPTITNDDIRGARSKYSAAVNQLPSGSINPVSTGGVIDSNGYMEMFLGKVEEENSNYVLSSTKSTETHGTTGEFIAFDLFFSTGNAATVYLTDASTVTVSGPTGIQNAARVAFIKQGSAGVEDELSVVQGLTASTSTSPIIWEPNYDAHTASGIRNASDVYGISTSETGAAAIPYKGVISEFTKAANVPLDNYSSTDTTKFADVTTDIKTSAGGIPTSAYASAIQLDAGITKYRIYMWIEGQDVDCENNASGGNVVYNLQFSLNSSASGE